MLLFAVSILPWESGWRPPIPLESFFILRQILLQPALGALACLVLCAAGALLFRTLRHFEQLARTAAEANRAKARFLHELSERIRTPMTGLVGMTDLLLNSELNPKQHEFASVVHESAHSLLEMLDKLLEYARLDDNAIQVAPADFDLQGLLEDTVFRFAGLAHEKGLRLSCCISPAVPHVVRGDAILLGRLLSILLQNAVRFTAAGDIVLSARLMREDKKYCSICFDVRDTGVGIARERQAQLFRKDGQNDRENEHSGTGLGLAIAQMIASRFYGHVDVHSDSGKGAVFWTVLRFQHAATPEPDVNGLELPPNFLTCVVSQHAPVRRMVCWKLAALGIRCTPLETASDIPEGTRIVFSDERVPAGLPPAAVEVALVRWGTEPPEGIAALTTPLRLPAVAASIRKIVGVTDAAQLQVLAASVASTSTESHKTQAAVD